jgi:hypothetical protein
VTGEVACGARQVCVVKRFEVVAEQRRLLQFLRRRGDTFGSSGETLEHVARESACITRRVNFRRAGDCLAGFRRACVVMRVSLIWCGRFSRSAPLALRPFSRRGRSIGFAHQSGVYAHGFALIRRAEEFGVENRRRGFPHRQPRAVPDD